MYGIITTSGDPDARFYSLFETKPTKTLDPAVQFERTDLLVNKIELKQGDLLRVFNSIADAPEMFKVTVDFALNKQTHQNYQKDFDPGLWTSLFNLRFPARLEKSNGVVIDGKLDPFTEQGMEGHIAWAVFDFKNDSDNSLHILEKGDVLTIFSHIANGGIEWQGRLEFEDSEYDTGEKITTFRFDENDRIIMGPTMQEKFIKTCVCPSHEVLKKWSIHTMPAQLIRKDFV